MLSDLKDLIPGASSWPEFQKNTSEQFEARLASVKVNDSPSIFFKGMAGSVLPIPISHGEGRAVFSNSNSSHQALAGALVPLQFVDNYRQIAKKYPYNPNGSTKGITAITTPDGRATIMMPHPERAFLTQQLSWHPQHWGKDSPWLKLFQNARAWIQWYDTRVYTVDDKTFEAIVGRAIDGIPTKYAQHIKNLAFVVEDEPSTAQRQKLKLRDHQTLFGLYEGVPLTQRSGNYNLVLPDKITVFKRPIEWSANSQDELVQKIKDTIWHEVAHYYGLGHGRIHELEDR